MKNILAILVAGLLGIFIFGVTSIFMEMFIFIPWIIVESIKWIFAMYSGFGMYKKILIWFNLPDPLKISKKQKILYMLLILQFVFTVGYSNEFMDYVYSFVYTLIFSTMQIYILCRVSLRKSIIVLISLITFLHILALLSFLSVGTDVVNNKWSSEFYYQTYLWVIALLVVTLVIDGIKYVVLYKIGKNG